MQGGDAGRRRRHAQPVREIVGVARQVKGRPDEREDLGSGLRPAGAGPVDDIYPDRRPASGLPKRLRRRSVRRSPASTGTARQRRDVMTLTNRVGRHARHRFRAVMVVTFAGLALLLAMVGVFGILAYSVQQRVREFGVRMALGATTRQVLALVLGGAARTIGVGAVIGMAAAALLARSISAFLFGVEPLDPLTFVTVASVLAVTAAIVAVLRSARRASIRWRLSEVSRHSDL